MAVVAQDAICGSRLDLLESFGGIAQLRAERVGPGELDLGVEGEDGRGDGAGLAGDGEADSLVGGCGEGEAEGEDAFYEVHCGDG